MLMTKTYYSCSIHANGFLTHTTGHWQTDSTLDFICVLAFGADVAIHTNLTVGNAGQADVFLSVRIKLTWAVGSAVALVQEVLSSLLI